MRAAETFASLISHENELKNFRKVRLYGLIFVERIMGLDYVNQTFACHRAFFRYKANGGRPFISRMYNGKQESVLQ